MTAKLRLSRVCLALMIPFALAPSARAAPTANEALVKKAMTELFVNRDSTAPARYWGDHYIQHNPGIADGRDELPDIVKALPPTFKYEPGMVVGHGDIVMIHGRYTEWWDRVRALGRRAGRDDKGPDQERPPNVHPRRVEIGRSIALLRLHSDCKNGTGISHSADAWRLTPRLLLRGELPRDRDRTV